MKHGIRHLLHTCVVSFLLSACGGGGGGIAPPATPDNLQLTNHDGYTRLSWDPVINATSYNIYWSNRSGVTRTNGNKITHSQNTVSHGALVNGQSYYYVVTAVNAGGESGISTEMVGQPQAEAEVADPLFRYQWHLDGVTGDIAGQDINVVPVWSCADSTCRGEGIRIAVVDGGMEADHPDLAANYVTGLGYNYYTMLSDPAPQGDDDYHGTSVAGIIAARDWNGLGVRGVAPRANLVAYSLLNFLTVTNEADAMTRGSPNVHVSSNSWGAPDDGDLHRASLAWRTAIKTGLTSGRNGLGTIYVWAGGNGDNVAPYADNSNYDGQANHYGVIAVAAVNDSGFKASYSEPGANILISAPGGEHCDTNAITTTDLTGSAGANNGGQFQLTANVTSPDYANDDYTACMNGTSAAAPVVSGTVALILQARPDLGWRDVRYILATTARKNDIGDSGIGGWANNGASHPVNHKYGFGVVDTDAAVTAAKIHPILGPEKTYSKSQVVNVPIPDSNITGISDTITITANDISEIEFIEITFSATNHTYSGDLEITLTHNTATESILSKTHYCITCSPYNGWVFSSVRHLDEAANGTWTLTVKDQLSGDTGTFQSWGLKFYGH